MSGFKHSVKVPTQYRRLAAIIKQSLEGKKSLKSSFFEEKHARKDVLQKTLNFYIDNRTDIDYAIEQTKILEDNPRFRKELCIVLVTELLRTQQLNGNSKPVSIVREYYDKLQTAFGGSGHQQQSNKLKEKDKPRYVRVNTNVLSTEQVFEMLAADGWRKKDSNFETYPEYLEAISSLEEDEYLVDMHMDDLLVFHSKWKRYWAMHDFVEQRKLMLQDKGTGLVVELLHPPPGSTVLDMCAAPGMKTVKLSNIMNNTGKIYAVERDFDRYRVLCQYVESAKATIVEPIHADALALDVKQYEDVEYVLVDPSCSGNGMQNRMSLKSEEIDPARLKKLAGLQIKMLVHAMKSFPNVKRVAYSTCSLNEAENEEVVQRCLQICPEFKMLSGKKALRNKWIRVGNPEFKNIGKNCIYSRPDEDFTDGIFMALFEKRPDGDE
ncbi:28S rRNA (cytosine-C(5))-methyltransferase [Episyrphus balteatus]|uniref:28S rRNA (cytosine-C(5))-methyltransferase n=1 Tax=Episyrphus balteatus TaxID=286459 RepID=UPI00248673F5|nr:28S rRNA (cytosine-C(5))-methyltransferase [Episyrphus balteatus]